MSAWSVIVTSAGEGDATVSLVAGRMATDRAIRAIKILRNNAIALAYQTKAA